MSQNMIVKLVSPQNLLSINMRGIDQLFPGFAMGDFALLYGSQAVLSLSALLCIRAQLPPQLGGLGSNVVFIDGANTFRLYQITRLARLHQIDPKQALDRIFISRAFTAYQMASLLLQKLEYAVNAYNAKLVVISDIAAMFLDKDIQNEEAKRIYSQIITSLSKFARENRAIIIVTYPPRIDNQRNLYLQAVTSGRANVVIAFRQTKYEREIILEKHPVFTLGSAELPSEVLPLTAFMETPLYG